MFKFFSAIAILRSFYGLNVLVDTLNIGKILFSNFSYGFPYPVTLISENSRVFKHAINQRLFKWGEGVEEKLVLTIILD